MKIGEITNGTKNNDQEPQGDIKGGNPKVYDLTIGKWKRVEFVPEKMPIEVIKQGHYAQCYNCEYFLTIIQ